MLSSTSNWPFADQYVLVLQYWNCHECDVCWCVVQWQSAGTSTSQYWLALIPEFHDQTPLVCCRCIFFIWSVWLTRFVLKCFWVLLVHTLFQCFDTVGWASGKAWSGQWTTPLRQFQEMFLETFGGSTDNPCKQTCKWPLAWLCYVCVCEIDYCVKLSCSHFCTAVDAVMQMAFT